MEVVLNKITNILGFMPPFLNDALIDSLKLVLPLFIIFIIIEVFENHFVEKITQFSNFSLKWGPLLGGLSVIATILFIKRFISIGTLLAVYIATSDEAIPVLMVYPHQLINVFKIITIKLLLAIFVGYVVDFIFNKNHLNTSESEEITLDENGCCDHKISEKKHKNIFLHPIKHTISVFFFIFIACAILNYLLGKFGIESFGNYMLKNSLLQPILVGILGLIPNCAISVVITIMYVTKIIGFGSVIAGLSSGAGLGLLVLFKKNNNIKESLLIITILLTASIATGVILELLFKIH